MTPHSTPLQDFVAPAGIALIGASAQAGTLGYSLLKNLQRSELEIGKVHLVSPKYPQIDGLKCHAKIDQISARVSLALIVAPTDAVPEIIESCGRKGVRAAIIYSAGLRPDTSAGKRLLEQAAHDGIRLFGPSALGLILPHEGLNLTPIVGRVPAGNLALVSQSTAVCASILDWNFNDEFGFSAIFAPGESDDIELPEILDYLAADPQTESILLYLEGLRDARGFLSAVRAVARRKPVIAVKAGHNPVSARIAAAHSGTRADRDDAFDAALRRAGVLRVNSVGDMFSAARALTTPRKPRGNRLAIVGNGGGPAVLALDAAADLDIMLASLTDETCRRLAALAPTSWSDGNPADLMFDATPEAFVAAIECCLADPGVDGVLGLLTPNTYVDPLAVAQALVDTTGACADKPVLACWLGEQRVRAARAALAHARFPTFRAPDQAVRAFSFMAKWVRNQALLLETPPALTSYCPPDTATATGIIEHALAEGRSTLTVLEAKAVLAAFHIPVSRSFPAQSPAEAIGIADRLGYPVAMSAVRASGEDAHNERQLRLRSAPEVALAFRQLNGGAGVLVESQVARSPAGRWLAVSIRRDTLFGPVIALSESGIASLVYEARSIGLPPLNDRLASAMLEVPHVSRLLGPLPGKPAVALEPLRDILQRASEIASELPSVTSMEIRSLIADDQGATAIEVEIAITALPRHGEHYAHMAIYPYPAQLESDTVLRDGTRCTVRPLRPEDTASFQAFVRRLSPLSRRQRFFSGMNELPPHQLARYAQIDYGREIVIIATTKEEGHARILGEARYTILMDRASSEFAVVVADDMAGRGLGGTLMRRLIDAARMHGLKIIRGEVLADNEPMLALMESLGFIVRYTDDHDVVEVELRLG